MLDKQVWFMEAPPPNLDNLKYLLLTSWCQIPQHTFRGLVESVPLRVRAVLGAKGGTNPIIDRRSECYAWSGYIYVLIPSLTNGPIWTKLCWISSLRHQLLASVCFKKTNIYYRSQFFSYSSSPCECSLFALILCVTVIIQRLYVT